MDEEIPLSIQTYQYYYIERKRCIEYEALWHKAKSHLTQSWANTATILNLYFNMNK